MLQEEEYTLDDARACLQQVWGYEDFRPGQDEAIEAVLEGRDVLAILPTGGGKSMCYFVPTLLSEGLTLVVSPLIALMEDQVAHLRARNIPAACISSMLSPRKVDEIWTNAEFGRYRLLYVAPERFETDLFKARAERLPVTMLAVDEAHCVSEWGHHFRPAYLQIPEARRLLGDPQTIAVTATATPQVRREVVEHLALRRPEVIVKGFDRPNLVWSIFRTNNKRSRLLDVVAGVEGSGIVYAATRRGVEDTVAWLEKKGVAATAYHAGLGRERRAEAQSAWIDGKERVIVATNAFGMGIDKPDVRFVVHYDVPGSLESYYQEAGRAGRDGDRAHAVLLFQPRDEETQRSLIEASHPDATQVRAVYEAICNLAQIPVGVCPEDPVLIDAEALSDFTGLMPGAIRSALDVLEQQGAIQRVPLRKHHGVVRFRRTADEIRRYARDLSNRKLAGFILSVMRSVRAEAFREWWDVDVRYLQQRTGLGRERLMRGLEFMSERELIDWQSPGRAVRLYLTIPRSGKLSVDLSAIRRDARRAEVRLEDMLRYARSVTCRRRVLLGYFGEAAPNSCGRCDVCLGRHEEVVITPEHEPLLRSILAAIDSGTFRDERRDGAFAASDDRLDDLLNWLIQEQYLRVEDPLADAFSLTEKAHAWLEGWEASSS